MNELEALRREILDVAYAQQNGHIPSALSILEITFAIYQDFIVSDAGNSNNKFVLSKGHGSLALYVTLMYFGLISKNELYSFCSEGSILGGHPDSTKNSHIEASTGSLGHGFPFALGLSLANKITSRHGRVFVLIGDGELNEGTNWESLLLGSQLNLNNLVLIIDQNDSSSRCLNLNSISEKCKSFGWIVKEIDGHSLPEIKSALSLSEDSPMVIIANTTKGYGVKEMENNPAWHHTKLTKDQYESIIKNNFP
jgi:transketolase